MDIPGTQTIPYNEDYSLMIYQNDILTNDTYFFTSKYYGDIVNFEAFDTYNGEFNTQLIYDYDPIADTASKACLNFNDYIVDPFNGNDDYYLPSVDELQAVYNAGYIPSGSYLIWTSTEYNDEYAYALNVATGLFEDVSKFDFIYAMPIRKVYLNDVITIERMNLLSSQAPILNGGVNNADEDVYKMLGGINGISKNSKILINE
jgi:hypothetical protein